MFKKELIIIRHGRSQYNVQATKGLDEGLTEFGHRQAKNVGDYFRDLWQKTMPTDTTSWLPVYSSPFLRCLQTANHITNCRCVVMPQLREYLNHSPIGSSVEIPVRKDEFGFNWQNYYSAQTFHQEVNEVFLNRMHEAYQALPERSIVVTHGLPALVLINIATNPGLQSLPVWDYSLDNCSISTIKDGRLQWKGRNLFHEYDYKADHYHADWNVKK